MLQILGLRSFVNREGQRVTSDAFFDKGWRAPDLAALFKNLQSYLDQIPAAEHWNLFYTVAHCGEKKREFLSQDVIAFDIDGVPDEQRKQAALAATGALGLSPTKTAMVSSGGGVHVIVQLKTPFALKTYFKEQKAAYGEACSRISKALAAAGIEHKVVDPVIFEPRRILRLPGTENRKDGKPPRRCELLQAALEPQDFDLAHFAPIKGMKEADALPARAMARYGTTDTKAIMEGCNFLATVKRDPHAINEPQWYAALSIVARLSPDQDGVSGRDMCHEISQGHPGYSPEETDRKIAQALDASGPRTCHGINGLWGKCHECPFFEKVLSPIQIVSADKIKTELTGFHTITAKGVPKPAIEDLRMFMHRELKYRTTAGSRTVYAWNGKHYEELSNNEVEQFAHKHFIPKVEASVMKRFREIDGATEIAKPEWFGDTTAGLVNFQNGVLDIKTKEFLPHSPDRGFRHVLPYEYDPDAKAPIFKGFMGKVTGVNTTLSSILLEFMGYSVSGDDYWIHKALILDGSGSNGKSTFVEVLQALVGRDSYSTNSLKDLDDEYIRATFDGKLFNISEETPTRALLDSSYFKALSSGSSVGARSPYKEPITLRNRAKFIVLVNEMSQAIDTSYGFFRRLLIVPFTQKITRETTPDFDPHIKKKMLGELPGIFNLALEGYHRLLAQGEFTESELVTAKVKEYERTVNTVMSWYEEEVVELTNGHANHFTPIQVLYDAYRLWCRNSELKPVNKDKFSKDLSRILPNYEARKIRRPWPAGAGDESRVRGLLGVALSRETPQMHKEEASMGI